MIMECKIDKLKDIIGKLIETLTSIPNIRNLPVNDLIIELMNSSIYFISIQ